MNDKMRAEFEAWWATTLICNDPVMHDVAMFGWQASRAAMVPIPASDLVTMYAERPTSDAEMIEFARTVEAHYGIGAARRET
jgi:hypothetical protein